MKAVYGKSVAGPTQKVRSYWDGHPLGTQFLLDDSIEIGSVSFFEHIRPRMTKRFPWIMELIREKGPELKGKSLLEIGCGMGFDALEWTRQGINVTAVDLSTMSVALAKRNLEQAEVCADLQVASGLKLPFSDESFDAVYSRGVLHHTGDTKWAIEEAWRILKPGGWAFICHLYRRFSWMYFLSRFGREPIEFVDGDPPVTDFLTVPEVKTMFSKYRFHELHLQHYRALKTVRKGPKAFLYNHIFRSSFNLLPQYLAKRLAYKISVYAMK